jgi:hypothetical protein
MFTGSKATIYTVSIYYHQRTIRQRMERRRRLMKRQEAAKRATMSQEALKMLVDRIKARQTRQTELWRRPMRPAAAIPSQTAETSVG